MQYSHSQADLDFVKQVETHQLPGDQFDHMAHLRVACTYFCQYGFDLGLERTSQTIRSYAESLHKPDKYHATYTYAYYRLLTEALAENPSATSWENASQVFKDNQTITRERVAQYYSDFLLATDESKQMMLLPDKQPFRSDESLEQATFEWIEGRIPLIVSMPHNGTCIPEDIAKNMTNKGLKVEDTDWYLRLLYHFAIELGCYVITPLYSRYVIDLNRPASGEALYPGANNTELCPTTSFDLEPLYQSGKMPSETEIERRKQLYWQPYHQQLTSAIEQVKQQFGKVLLFEAHSIASHVPRFFDGQLPDFNFGTNEGQSCTAGITQAVEEFYTGDYSKIINGRFKGGYITRHYAKPTEDISTLQLELSQATYMDEDKLTFDAEKAQRVKPVLKSLLTDLIGTIIK